jgi:hypothetical protein
LTDDCAFTVCRIALFLFIVAAAEASLVRAELGRAKATAAAAPAPQPEVAAADTKTSRPRPPPLVGVSRGSMQMRQAPALPLGWSEKTDQTSGRKYYVNATSGKTQWERPSGAGGSANPLGRSVGVLDV